VNKLLTDIRYIGACFKNLH